MYCYNTENSNEIKQIGREVLLLIIWIPIQVLKILMPQTVSSDKRLAATTISYSIEPSFS